MRDGKPGYERLKICLERLGEKNVMFSYYNPKGTKLLLRCVESTIESIQVGIQCCIDFPDGIKSISYKYRVAESTVKLRNDSKGWLEQLALTPQESRKRKREQSLAGTEEPMVALLSNIGMASLPDHSPSETITKCLLFTLEGFIHPLLAQRIISVLS